MSYLISFEEGFLSEFRRIIEWCHTTDQQRYAERLSLSLTNLVQVLETHHRRYPLLRPNPTGKEFRRAKLLNYVLIYEVLLESGDVTIIAIQHERANLSRLIEDIS